MYLPESVDHIIPLEHLIENNLYKPLAAHNWQLHVPAMKIVV